MSKTVPQLSEPGNHKIKTAGKINSHELPRVRRAVRAKSTLVPRRYHTKNQGPETIRIFNLLTERGASCSIVAISILA